MAESTLTETEVRLCEINEILCSLLGAVKFNGGLSFSIARRLGVKMPYRIEAINDPSKDIKNQIVAMMCLMDELAGEAERDASHEQTCVSSSGGGVIYWVGDEPEAEIKTVIDVIEGAEK